MTQVMLPVGRVVGGHPMRRNAVTDDRTNPPTVVMQADNITPATDMWVGVAVQKGAETHWNQTEWGAVIYNVGVAAWPGGEHGAPTFSWKITDGDSPVPNQKGTPPNTREGYPGHWIIGCGTRFNCDCFHVGRYTPMEQIRNEKEIKAGDYCRILLEVVGNNIKKTPKSPGVYVNPMLFELTRAGIAIQLGNGPDAGEAFGGAAGVLPAGALIDTAIAGAPPVAGGAPPIAAPPVTPPIAAYAGAPPTNVAPHTTFLNNAPPPPVAAAIPPAAGGPPPPVAVVENYNVQGVVYSRAALEAALYTPEQIAALPRA